VRAQSFRTGKYDRTSLVLVAVDTALFKVAFLGAHTGPNFLPLLEAFLELGFSDAVTSVGVAV